MPYSFFFNLIYLFLALTPLKITGAHFENLVNLTVKIEDANFNLKIKNAKFNGQELRLEESEFSKPRSVTAYKLPPGRYIVQWSTHKPAMRFANEPAFIEHERILVLENGDTIVRISIKGDTIAIF